MTLSSTFHEEARAEFDEATAFYASGRFSLAAAFVEAVEQAVEQARRHPESASLIKGRVRRMRVGRFPYSVMYSRVNDTIRILAVAHDRRRPYYWIGRR